jgi:hypothetical protein
MPKLINARLVKIECTKNKFGGFIELSGDIFGATFQNDPDNPNDEKVRKDIYPFPSPIRLAEGQASLITMEPVTFELSSAPSQEPVGEHPRFLKIVGALNNGLKPASFSISNVDNRIPFELPAAEFPLVLESEHIKIELAISLIVSVVF